MRILSIDVVYSSVCKYVCTSLLFSRIEWMALCVLSAWLRIHSIRVKSVRISISTQWISIWIERKINKTANMKRHQKSWWVLFCSWNEIEQRQQQQHNEKQSNLQILTKPINLVTHQHYSFSVVNVVWNSATKKMCVCQRARAKTYRTLRKIELSSMTKLTHLP